MGEPGVSRRSLRVVTAATISALLIVTLVSGCGSVFNSGDDGFDLAVPVLWAGQDADGMPTGGIESAGVWAGDDGTPGYSTDLEGIEAQGAGAAWKAASGTAASVGALFSALDPTTLGIRFTITGPIDGPSGGAALTVGVIAATRHQQLQPGVTMTGTITPDGSIGRVSGIPSKLRAAASAGYKTVLLPQSNLIDRTVSNIPASMAEFGTSLGLTVIAVDDIGDAYQLFTGTSLSESKAPPQPLSAPVAAAAKAATGELMTRFRNALASRSTSTKAQAEFSKTLAAAQSSSAAGDTTKAYALALAGYRGLLHANGVDGAKATLKRSGTAALQAELLTEAQALTTAATELRQRYADTTSFGFYQELALPAALAPLTYAVAVLTDTQEVLGADSSREALLASAAVIADQRASIDSTATTSFAVVSATPSIPSDTNAPAITLLSGYTNFLINAGNANQEYYTEVLGGGRTAPMVAGSLERLVRTLGDEASAIPPDEQDLGSEFVQSSQALSYFIFSTALVTDRQAFEIRDEQSGRLPNPEPVRNSVRVGRQTVDGIVASLARRDVDAGLANWLASWGTQSAATTAGSKNEVSGSLVALHQIWGASVDALILQAGADRPGT